MDKTKLALAKAYHQCKKEAQNSINKCYYPSCKEKSINSHILQKNGILSVLAPDRHLVEMEINQFTAEVHRFKRTGINEIYSFNCFCSNHDKELFKAIEDQEIDFKDYFSLLLFTLRTHYNELYRKQVNVRMYENLINKHPELFDNEGIKLLKRPDEQEKLGIVDLDKTEKMIWEDLTKKTESFVSQVRHISRLEICMSAIFNYETTAELWEYKSKHGIDKEDVSQIFINLFPYKGKSILIMSYSKNARPEIKGYVNGFFKENEKRLQRKITNLMLFQCETWVCSESFYKQRIKPCEIGFADAVRYSTNNMHERRLFDLNLFKEDFCEKFKVWKRENFAVNRYR